MEFSKQYLSDLAAREAEFVLKMKEKVYEPSLLYDDEKIVQRISHHPAALWRIRSDTL